MTLSRKKKPFVPRNSNTDANFAYLWRLPTINGIFQPVLDGRVIERVLVNKEEVMKNGSKKRKKE